MTAKSKGQKRSKTMPVLASPTIDLSGRISLSLREVAQLHGVSARTAWEWYRQGLLKGRKIGQILRFNTEHVRALFRDQPDNPTST